MNAYTPLYPRERVARRHLRMPDWTNACGAKSNFNTLVPAEITCERCQKTLSPDTLSLDAFKWEGDAK